MKKIFKTLFTAAVILTLFSTFTFAETAVYQTENYILNVSYNETLVPGDAIFVRLTVSIPKNAIPKSHKKTEKFVEPERKATLRLYQGTKVIEKADFYPLEKNKKPYTTELLCGLPLSTWLKNDAYTIKVIYSFENEELKEFTLPLTYKGRTFVSETIDFDEKNSNIKNDNSPERIAQIQKLNNILFTTFPADTYTNQEFVKPVQSDNFTSYFGDRRTYTYTNGKSETSLHNGNDYGVPEGTPVIACADGRVVMAENRISTGWSIVIEHLPGLYSLYYHLSEMNVKEGDFVSQNMIIGKSGSTGLATGPHLHWEMRLNGEAVRPEFFMSNFMLEPAKTELQ